MTPLAVSRVARGAASMDAKAPGWAGQARPARLDLSDPHNCLLKQVFPGRPFGDSVAALGLASRLIENGLAVSAAERDDGGMITSAAVWWDDLHAAWLGEIAKRTGHEPGAKP